MAFPKKEMFPAFDQEVAWLGRALGYPARIFILRILSERGPIQFAELARQVPLNESAVTAHLKILREGGLIKVEINGLSNIYTISQEGIGVMFDLQSQLYRVLNGQMKSGESLKAGQGQVSSAQGE